MRQSSFVIKYNDKDATDIISNMTESLTCTDVASGEPDTLSLVLQNRRLKWLRGYFPANHDFVKLWLKVHDWNRTGDDRKKYFGRFQVDSFTASDRFTLEGISIPINTAFNVTGRNKTYKSTTVKRILKDIAERAEVSLVYDASNFKIKEISQSGNTDMAFAFSLCSDYGLGMKVYNNKLVIYEQTRYEKKKRAFTIDYSELGDSDSYTYQRNITTLYDSVKLQYSNRDDKTVTYEYKIPGKKGNRTLFISSSADSHADAERKAKMQLLSNLRNSETLTMDLMGDLKYQSCCTFGLTGFGKIDGKYFLDKVTHSIDGAYRCSLEAHRVVTDIG